MRACVSVFVVCCVCCCDVFCGTAVHVCVCACVCVCVGFICVFFMCTYACVHVFVHVHENVLPPCVSVYLCVSRLVSRPVSVFKASPCVFRQNAHLLKACVRFAGTHGQCTQRGFQRAAPHDTHTTPHHTQTLHTLHTTPPQPILTPTPAWCFQVKRMIGGIRNVLFSTYSQTPMGKIDDEA